VDEEERRPGAVAAHVDAHAAERARVEVEVERRRLEVRVRARRPLGEVLESSLPEGRAHGEIVPGEEAALNY
jgi:hypothetical protein